MTDDIRLFWSLIIYFPGAIDIDFRTRSIIKLQKRQFSLKISIALDSQPSLKAVSAKEPAGFDKASH
jgi:hypothetical protein